MIVTNYGIQGVVHEAKYKVGDVVEHINFGNSRGTIIKVLFAENTFWYVIKDADNFIIEEPEEALKLINESDVLIDWCTGTIPQPTKFCILVIESKDEVSDIVYYSTNPSGIQWCWAVNDQMYLPNDLLKWEISRLTGRWYIKTNYYVYKTK